MAEAKSHFSDLLNRAGYRGERFLIRKRGKPIAAIVSKEDLDTLEHHAGKQPVSFLEAAAELREFDDFPAILDEIVRRRQGRRDREVNLD